MIVDVIGAATGRILRTVVNVKEVHENENGFLVLVLDTSVKQALTKGVRVMVRATRG